MANRFDDMPASPFRRLADLIDGIEPGHGRFAPISLSLGEPQHPVPDFVAPIMARTADDFGRYPPASGTDALRTAAAGWLTRRFALPKGLVDPLKHVLAVNGTREALFTLPMVANRKDGTEARPAVLMPNPFYQCYAAAALAAGAEPVYVPATRETGFLPDFAGLPDELLARTIALYCCSPANPQGAIADEDYLRNLIGLAREHDFLVIMDECYADIYDAAAPLGALQVAAEMSGSDGNPFANVAVFHSLSKRSNLPGLRSGFCAGEARLMADFAKFRNVASPQTPLPLQEVACAAWGDDAHAAANRERYRAKNDIAERILGNRFGFYRPPGGFFLWLDVGDGEAAARHLWAEAAIKVLPGGYLSRDTATGNPGTNYIRVALVNDESTTEEALTRLADALD